MFYLQDGAVIVYIYKDGGAHADKRLQPYDKITEIEGKKITADMSFTDLKKIFKRRYLVVGLFILFCYNKSAYFRLFLNFSGQNDSKSIRSTPDHRNGYRDHKKGRQRHWIQFY